MFGDNKYDEWSDFLTEYTPPPFTLPRHLPALSFGVAGPGSGVPFHFHGPGFGETVYGRKRWFLTEPASQPEFHPNKTTLQWFLQDYQKVKKEVNWITMFLLGHEILFLRLLCTSALSGLGRPSTSRINGGTPLSILTLLFLFLLFSVLRGTFLYFSEVKWMSLGEQICWRS